MSPLSRNALGLTSLFFFAVGQMCTAQLPVTIWATAFHGLTAPLSADVATDQLGNVYVVGSFTGNVDFDPGPNLFGMSSPLYDDAFLVKLDPSGAFLWAKQFGGSNGFDQGLGVEVTEAGDVVIAGIYYSTDADFDPDPGFYPLTGMGAYAAKLTEDGALVWAKSIGGGILRDLALDPEGDILTVGNFAGASDFDPSIDSLNLTSVGGDDVFVSKLNPDGSLLWAEQLGGGESDDGLAVTSDESGNVYVGGFYLGTADFDPGPGMYPLSASGIGDAYVCKFNPDGFLVWAKGMGGTATIGTDAVRSIAVTDSLVLTTGGYWETADFDPDATVYDLVSTGSTDCFVSVLDTQGIFVAAYSIGGFEGGEGGDRVEVDALGAVYVAGYFQGTVDFDPGPDTQTLTGGSGARLVCKLSGAGAYQWAFANGGIRALVLDSAQNIYCVGRCSSTEDVDPSSTIYQVSSDGALTMKLSQEITTGYAETDGGQGLGSANIHLRGSDGYYTAQFPRLLDDGSITIHDDQGRLIRESMILGGASSISFNLQNEPGGLYVLTLWNGCNKASARIARP